MNTPQIARPVVVACEELIVERGDKIPLKHMSWLWKPYLALRELSVWAGLPDAGKGTAVAHIIANITNGQLKFDDPKRDEVLILSAEETHDTTTLPRIKAAGGDLSKVHIVKGVGRSLNDESKRRERVLALKNDMELVKAYLAENPKIVLFVVDPIDCYFGNAKKNSTEHVTEIYGNLKAAGVKHGLSVLLIDHLNKNAGQAAIHRVSGAGAASARPRLVWLIARDTVNKNIRHFTCMKGNILSETEKQGKKFEIVGTPLEIEGRETSQPILQWRGNSDVDADALLQAMVSKKPVGAPPKERAKAEAFLREELAEGERLSSEIYETAKRKGIDTSKGGTLDRAKKALGIKSYQKEIPGPWYLPGIVEPVSLNSEAASANELFGRKNAEPS